MTQPLTLHPLQQPVHTHSADTCLLGIYSVPCTALGTGHTSVNKTGQLMASEHPASPEDILVTKQNGPCPVLVEE